MCYVVCAGSTRTHITWTSQTSLTRLLQDCSIVLHRKGQIISENFILTVISDKRFFLLVNGNGNNVYEMAHRQV